MQIISHASIAVHDMEKMMAFYDTIMATIGAKRFKVITKQIDRQQQGTSASDEPAPMADDQVVAIGYGKCFPEFWIQLTRAVEGSNKSTEESFLKPNPQTHVAFAASSEGMVKKFYDAAISAGGKCHGPPGLRPHYHPKYYAGYVVDPEGNHIEAAFVNIGLLDMISSCQIL
jgi:catechol 2,3-dioxygenase-like lactoylglutathione lyase family enzyme